MRRRAETPPPAVEPLEDIPGMFGQLSPVEEARVFVRLCAFVDVALGPERIHELLGPKNITLLGAAEELRNGMPRFWREKRLALRRIASALARSGFGREMSEGLRVSARDAGDIAPMLSALDRTLALAEDCACHALRVVEEAGYTFSEETGALNAPAGSSGGRPREQFRRIVWAVFRGVSDTYPNGTAGAWNTPETREEIAALLRPYFPAAWLGTGPRDRIARAVSDGLQGKLGAGESPRPQSD